MPRPQKSTLFPYTTLFRSQGIHAITNLDLDDANDPRIRFVHDHLDPAHFVTSAQSICRSDMIVITGPDRGTVSSSQIIVRSEEHTSELQSHVNVVCRLLLE